MSLFLEAPIEELKLSKRVRNALHLNGLHTLRSVLACDHKTAMRGLGTTARAELTSALEANGFAPPPHLRSPAPGNTSTNADVSKLLGELTESFQKWGARLEYFEMRIQALTARGCGQQYSESEEADVMAYTALAHQFRAQLTSIRTITAALRDVIRLPAEQQELVALLEQQSVRLSVLVYRLFEMLSPDKSPPNPPGKDAGRRNSPVRWSDLAPELAVGCEFLLEATAKATAPPQRL